MLALPQPIADFFALPTSASLKELGGVLDEDAIVRDERRTHRGLDAIRNWRIETMARTPFQARPLSVEDQNGAVVVKAQVSGSFPGSPVLLDHRFSLSDGRIVMLEIA